MEKFTLPAFAKINWSLRVLGKRDDGFHEICTVFQTVSLSDFLTFTPRQDKKIILTCDDRAMPTDERNLVVRAALALREKFGAKKGAEIHLEKNIPSPGGLGGGSADAAIALLGLAKLWKLSAKKSELTEIGKKLGADVPFFFIGGTALGTGLGTEISQLEDITENNLLIVTPNENVPTGEAYKSLNAPLLTNQNAKSILQICCDEANSTDLLQTELQNDFESAIFRLKPAIAQAKQKLSSFGARKTLMSGSGASVWGIFENEESRQIAFEDLRKEEDWRVFSSRTVSKVEYIEHLALCRDFLSDSN